MRSLPGARFAVYTLLFVLVIVSLPSATAAQTSDVALGLTPYQSFHASDVDAVNLSNGNVLIRIPLINYPQRGGLLKLSFALINNSNTFASTFRTPCVPHGSCTYYWLPGPANGSSFLFPGSRVLDEQAVLGAFTHQVNGSVETTYYAVQASDGSIHPTVPNSPLPGNVATDATGFWMDGSNNNPPTVVIDRHGIRTYVVGQGSVLREDPNGNQISGGYTDTVGRNIPYSSESELYPGTSTTDFSNCTGPLPISKAWIWSVPGTNGGTIQFKFCEVNIQVNVPANHPSPVQAVASTGPFLQSIVLPNNTAFTFEYNDRDPGDPFTVNFGTPTKITLPTGGTISYTYATIESCGTNAQYRWSRRITMRTVDAADGTGPHAWTYDWGGANATTPYAGKTTVADPLANQTVHTFTNLGLCSWFETQTQYYQGTTNLLKSTQTDYKTLQQTGNAEWHQFSAIPIRVITTWPNGQVAKTETDYDSVAFNGTGTYGNVTAHREYDYGNGAPPTSPLRTTSTNYLAFANSTYLTNNLLDPPSSVQVTDGGGTQRAYTTYGYDEYPLANVGVIGTEHDSAPPDGSLRGNQTSVHRLLNASTVSTANCPISVGNGYLVSYATYNDTGTVNTSVDSCGTSYTDPNHMTTFAYSTNYAGAFPTSITNPKRQQTNHTYDFNTGLLASTTDPNSQTTNFVYDMSGNVSLAGMWRITQVSYPDGGQANLCYTDTPGTSCSNSTLPIQVVTTKKITSAQNEITTNIIDGLGRVIQKQLNSDPQCTVLTDITYDADGRKASVSNPYCTKTDPTYGITSYVYDGIGRTCVVVPPDGTASGPACPTTQPSNDIFTTYLGNTTTVTDQQLKSRKSQTDGLGRLTNVWEDPTGLNYQTVYTYDALDDLASVAQGSSRNRSFVFDSLKHMTSSTNPEAGTVTYTYDADSNVITKADARSITITYSYDVLNRMLGRTYSNGDPSVSYTYDQATCLAGEPACYNVGRRTSVADAAGSEGFSYDKMGREWAEQRITNAITKTTSYTYNLDGSLATLKYPSGRTVNYAYSGAARPTSAIDTANSINYATLGTYAPQGALAGLTLGEAGSFAGINFSASYTKRLQPNEFKASSTAGTALDLTYNFLDASSHNNGNVMGITNNRDTTRSQSFSYDSLNRIATAKTSSTSGSNCWGETYTVDQWANLTSIGAVSGYTGCAQESLSVTALANNQLSATGFSYDAAGNMLGDAVNTYGWNAESEIKSAAGVNYTYDGDGDRVQKSNGKVYWYGAGTEILDESDSSGNITDEYVFFGGKRVAHRVVSSGAISYYAEDFLGSSRGITTSTGMLCYDADFYPYGGERIVTNTCPQNYKFEGKERDSETVNDDFGARFYNSRLGRWLSADWSAIPAPVPYADLTNPQTLNLYAMVRDNPETFADLDGHCGRGDAAQGCDEQSAPQEQEPQKQDQNTQNQSSGGFWQRLGNALSGNGWKTNAEVADAQRQWLSGLHVEQVGADGKLSPIDWSEKSDKDVAAAYDYMHQVMSAATANRLWSLVGVAATVTFGHGARHLAGTGLNQGAVESAIQQDIEAGVKDSTQASGNFWGRVNVGGQTIEYRAYTLPNGTINVGTYYIP